MDNSRKKFLIITASVLLHMVGMFVIFVLYHQPSGDLFADFDPSKAIDVTETIFSNPQTEQAPLSNQAEPDKEWGQLNPRASTLGASMEMPDGPIGVEMPGDASGTDAGSDEGDSPEPQSSQEHENGNSLEFSPHIQFDGQESVVTSIGKEAATNKTSDAPTKALSKKSQARKALAGITRGYLQQLHDEGENLIKTLGGDPNKKPTAEQLKYERYLAKIQWCLQNAHSINQEKCQPQEALEAVMKIYFVLNREGKMTGFKIIQSSGKAYVDQYISSLFQFASSSFPPLPAYVKEDYFPLTYTVMVNWNSASHMGFSRY
jgi:outer membrane biosynthesis protein TonB